MIEAVLKRGDLRTIGRRSGTALFAFAARSLQQVSTLAITLLAARFLAPADYGIYSLAAVFLVLVQTLTYTGVYQFVLTPKADDALVLATSFWLILGLVSAASLLLALAAWPLARLFDAPALAGVLVMLALVQPLASVGAWSSAALLRRGAITLNFTVMFVQNAVALAGGVAILWWWHSLYALVAFRYLRVISGAVLYAMLGGDCPGWRFCPQLARTAAAFSGGLYGSRLLGFLARYAADLLLGALHSPAAVGLYRFGNRMATGATDIVSQPMMAFAGTQFGAAARRGSELAAPLARYAGTSALLVGLVAATIVVLARDVVELLFRPAYLPALAVTYAMALRAAASCGQLLVEPAFAALGRTRWVMAFDLVSTAIALVAVLALSPLGITALAWAQVAVVVLSSGWAFHLLHARGGIDVRPALRAFAGALALAASYGAALWLLRTLTPAGGAGMLLLDLAAAAGLALATLALASRLRIFSLQAFAG